ncbi:MAG TPA: hypothetical protein VJT31_39655 [Rugosimonospora sp.]|nr:hypothetical protein [Rugosimonospora sp.]
MKTEVEIQTMRERAYRDQYRATDQDDREGRAYAEGVEAALLWALGHIKESDLTSRMEDGPALRLAPNAGRPRRRRDASVPAHCPSPRLPWRSDAICGGGTSVSGAPVTARPQRGEKASTVDTTDNRTFAERRRDAALDEMDRITTRDSTVADIVRGTSGVRVGEVVVIADGDGATTGAFLVQRTGRDGVSLWHAVNDGRRLSMGWFTRAGGILHLLAVRDGDGDDSGTAGRYAARVLGIKDAEG